MPMPILTRLPIIAGMVVSLQVAVTSPRIAKAETRSDTIATIVAKVKPAVVKIISVKQPGKKTDSPPSQVAGASAPDSDTPMTADGSGFLIDPAGFIATNKHVIEDSASLFVMTDDGIRYKATIVGVTAKSDIALLKIEAGKPLPFVGFGDSDKMRVGDTVIAIGSPFGFDESVTAGIVSAVNRDISESPFDDYIQTDASINHGNSGGPLFNLSGEVIGMNSVLYAPGSYSGSIGLGFSIPSDVLSFVYKRLIADGQIRAGMLPIRTQQIKWMLFRATGAPGLSGALVDAVDLNGDKTMQGQVEPGDIVLTFNGQPVSDPRDLARKAAMSPIGSDAALEIFRNGQRKVVHVPIQGWPEGTPPVLSDSTPKTLGLGLAVGPKGGVAVAMIDPAGSAASSGIKLNDVIVRIRDRAVSDPDQALAMLKALPPGKDAYVAVLVERDGNRTWMPLAIPE
jgi:serine protease Do